MKQLFHLPTNFKTIGKSLLWFFLGIILGLFFFIGIVVFIYQRTYNEKIFPGIYVNGVDFGGKKKEDVEMYFSKKNEEIYKTSFVFKSDELLASASARDLQLGYDEKLLSIQAYSLGRSNNLFSNFALMAQSYLYGVSLSPAYHYSDDVLMKVITPLKEQLSQPPVDAQFEFKEGKVVTFKPSRDGKEVNMDLLKKALLEKSVYTRSKLPPVIFIEIPLVTLKPNITTEKVNNMGIKELIGRGTSLFQHSIENRVYNLSLASSRIHGVLVPPGEVFSMVKSLGDISSLSGYKQAYVIQNGRTVLGDGGGVCQVSTTLFRAVLNAGLPILERNPHAYRVSYYEEDSLPGIDAAIYSPTVDLKFKNDTGKYILIQTILDPQEMRLTFELYGTLDGREVSITQPIIHSQSPAPAPLYQDDPTLPKGVVRQVDWAAAGANVSFSRTVKKGDTVLYSDTFKSNYRPWQAIFLRGTKE